MSKKLQRRDKLTIKHYLLLTVLLVMFKVFMFVSSVITNSMINNLLQYICLLSMEYVLALMNI